MVAKVRGSLDGSGLVIGIVQARFNEPLTEQMLATTMGRLAELGVAEDAVHVLSVPGAVEIPLAARRLADSGRVDAVIGIGVVIRGETGHYDFVCQMVADGCLRTSLELDTPVIFGVLTTENSEQAVARIPRAVDHAEAAVEMANLLRGKDA